MKRFFILASATIVALASCTKSEVVYNEAPQEIAFKQVTNVMTKTYTDGLSDGTMSVFAYWNGSEYFGNSMFINDVATTTYKGAETKYWPVSGNVDFLFYAPYDSQVTRSDANTLTGIKKNLNDQTDILYGNITEDKQTDAVTVELKHALANILVQVSGSNIVNLVKVELLKSTQAATAVINTNTSTVTWTALASDSQLETAVLYETTTDSDSDGKVDGVALTNTINCTEFLVVPLNANATSIKLTYRMGASAAVTHTIPLTSAKWVAGTKYTYSITVTPTEIKFTPSAGNWITGSQSTLS